MDNLITKLKIALGKRTELIRTLSKEGTNIFSLFDGKFEGITGLVIDCFGPLVLFLIDIENSNVSSSQISILANWCLNNVPNISSVYLKKFASKRNSIAQENYSPDPIAGIPLNEKIIAHEWQLKYFIRPFDGNLVGFFHDQRNNRKFLSNLCNGKTILNTFSYTCSFSTILAKHGGKLTSVDISKKHIDWGKENFKLNHINHKEHFFVVADIFSYLKFATKKELKFDIIIIDPPSFSRTKNGKVFSISKDFKKLLSLILNISKSGTMIFISINYLKWEKNTLYKIIEELLLKFKLRWEYIPLPPIPKDFMGKANFPKTILLQLK